MTQSIRTLLKQLILGQPIRSQLVIGCNDPQSDVSVWLHGLDQPIDVTRLHMMACGAPLTIGIGLSQSDAELAALTGKLSLRLRRTQGQRLMGKIGLRLVSSLHVGAQYLCLFHVTHHRNACISPLRRFPLYLQSVRWHRQTKDKNKEVPITVHDAQAMAIFYLCPRPVALVTVIEGQSGNMFPMNLMGDIGDGYFAFGLNRHRAAAPLVDRVRRITLSNIPLEQAPIATKLSSNHRKPSIAWKDLPFETMQWNGTDTPVPAFALRVREMHVENVHLLGSHLLFVAKVAADTRFAEGPQWCSTHGFYPACR